MEPFTLHTDRLVLDSPAASDIDLITRYCQDPVFERYLTVPWPYRRGDAEYFVNEFVPSGWKEGREQTWALRRETGGALMGVVGLRMPSTDVGFWLGAEHRGNGYLPEALAAVIDWAFRAPEPGLSQVLWECVAGNAASAAVARKCGFSYTGEAPTRAAWRDGSRPLSWQGVLRADDDRNPKPGWPG